MNIGQPVVCPGIRLYRWYLAHQINVRKQFFQQQKSFDPVLYQQLIQAFKKGPPDKEWLDFTPLFDNQMGGKADSIGAVKVLPDQAQVTVRIRDRRGSVGCPMVVMLKPQDERWKIQDLKYASGARLLGILNTISG